jgi:hypothetical protein
MKLTKQLGNIVSTIFHTGDFRQTTSFIGLTRNPVIDDARIIVNMLWVQGQLSRLERLSASSFVSQGYEVKLWTYDPELRAPDGVLISDARTILHENRIFRYQNGSFAGFANLFRYTVLSMYGGMWSDLDVICFVPEHTLRTKTPMGFLVTEHTRDYRVRQITNNLIYHPRPQRGDIIDIAQAVTDHFDPQKLSWGDCGPRLLSNLGKLYPKLLPMLMEPDFANPLSKKMPTILLRNAFQLPKGSCFLHCYNERWRRKGIDKNNDWPTQSILSQLEKQYV